MRICYIASTIEVPYRNGLGSGGSTHAYEVARTLVEQGVAVTLCCRKGSNQTRREALDGISVRRIFRWNSKTYRLLQSRRWLWRVARIPYYFVRSVRHTFELLLLAGRHPFDLIYERSSRSTLAGTWAAFLLGIPLLLEINDEGYSRHSLRRARSIVTPDAAILPREFRCKAESLEWGVNTRLFHPGVDGSGVRKRYGLECRQAVLFVGSGLPWHGVECILDAAPRVLAKRPGTIFLIVGGGPDIERCRRKAKERRLQDAFVFTGAVDYSEIPAFVAAADIAVAPYTSELAANERHRFASPLKVFEYMAAGKAVILTRVANIRNTVEHTVSGLVIPENSPDALSEAILDVLERPEWACQLGQNARRRAETMFSWARHCSILRELFAEATNTLRASETRLTPVAKVRTGPS